MRVASLFAGIGGFDLALQRENHEIVFANEYDKYAASVYDMHFEACDRRDIRDIPSGDIPNVDMVVGGPPCQAFSLAGKQRGFEDERGNLIFEFIRVVADKRPRYFLFENVRMFLSHDKGKTWQTLPITF